MKKEKIFEYLGLFVMALLNVMALIMGGGVMAEAAPAVRDYGSNDADPNANTPLEGAVKTGPQGKGGVAQHGKDANASVLQQMNLLDNKMFRKIIEHHALRFPFYTDMFTKAAQFAFTGHKEADYPEVGDIKTESNLLEGVGSTSVGAKDHEVYLKVPKADCAIFRKSYTITVPGIEGYDEGKTEADGGNGETLMLYVTKSDDETSDGWPKVFAVNGPDNGSGQTYVPTIPAGTLVMLSAPALAEEEVEVDPLNLIPTMKKAFLQKKGYSVAFTDFFEEAVKEVDWEKDRVKRQTLDAYKKLYTSTALFGAKRKFYKRTRNGMRICYTQEGLINQIRMMYQLKDGKWTKADLIAIAKMLFTAYTDAVEICVYMGSDAIEGLLNIDWGKDATKIVYMKDENLKLNIASFETPYGMLRFKHEKSLTYHHLEKAAFAVPMEDCLRVYRDNGSTFKVDGKKGETGAVEELTKEFFVQDDCFICNTMASMLIGPKSLFESGYGAGIVETYESVTELPAEATAGDRVYLTESYEQGDEHFERGLYEYVGGEWVTFNRAISA